MPATKFKWIASVLGGFNSVVDLKPPNSRNKMDKTKFPINLLTVNDAANVLGFSIQHTYRLANRNILPSYKIGYSRRFKLTEILDWFDTRVGGQI